MSILGGNEDEVTITSTSSLVLLGHPATFICAYKGYDTVNIFEWRRSRVPVVIINSVCELIVTSPNNAHSFDCLNETTVMFSIRNMTKEDNGTIWSCVVYTATNRSSSNNASVFVVGRQFLILLLMDSLKLTTCGLVFMSPNICPVDTHKPYFWIFPNFRFLLKLNLKTNVLFTLTDNYYFFQFDSFLEGIQCL